MKKINAQAKVQQESGFPAWVMFSFMYMITSPTVYPIDKAEFFWRFLAGPLNFLPI